MLHIIASIILRGSACVNYIRSHWIHALTLIRSVLAVKTECEENVCKNGGTCEMLAGSVICTCPPHLTGVVCELRKYIYQNV